MRRPAIRPVQLAAALGVDYHRIEVHDGRNNPATAIATGVGLVDSRFYTLFGDDDIMLPRFITAHVGALADDFDVCASAFVRTDGALLPLREVRLPEAMIGDLLAGRITINDGAMTRTDCVRDMTWDPDLDQVILYPIWLELLYRGARFTRLDEPTFLYRRHDGNISDQLDEVDQAKRESVRERYRALVLARDGAIPGPTRPDRRRGHGRARPARGGTATPVASTRPRGRAAAPSRDRAAEPEVAVMPYSPIDYWSRLHERHDLSAVGQSALPLTINLWLYRVLERNVIAFLRRHHLTEPFPDRAFDVGAGTGYWVDVWHRLGAATVDGCDLVPEVAADLGRRHPGQGDFVVADISHDGELPDRRYPFVSCMNVLLHVTDDAAFAAGLRNVAALVEPGGHLLLAEPIVDDRKVLPTYDPEKHSRARQRHEYVDPLVAAGLTLVAIGPATVLANNPIEAGSPAAYRRYLRWWGFVTSRTKRDPDSARWIGPLVDVADRIAMHSGAAPSTKLVLLRRPI